MALPVSGCTKRFRRRLAQPRVVQRLPFCLREEIRGGRLGSRLPVVQKAVDSARAKRFTAAGAARLPLFKEAVGSAGAKRFRAGGWLQLLPLLKGLPVRLRERFTAAGSRLRCSKAVEFCQRRSDSRRWAQQASVVQKAVDSARGRFHGGRWCSRLPVLKGWFCLRRRGSRQLVQRGFALLKKAAGFRLREEIHGGGWRSKLPIVKKEEKDGIALCGDFGGV